MSNLIISVIILHHSENLNYIVQSGGLGVPKCSGSERVGSESQSFAVSQAASSLSPVFLHRSPHPLFPPPGRAPTLRTLPSSLPVGTSLYRWSHKCCSCISRLSHNRIYSLEITYDTFTTIFFSLCGFFGVNVYKVF